MASYKKVLIQGDDISHLNNNSNYSTFSGSYNDLSSKPSIPTHTSHLTNNSGYINSSHSITGSSGGINNCLLYTSPSPRDRG